MPMLYTVAELLAATGGRGENLPADGIGSISIDSREVLSGALFVAIKGDRFDGHDFVQPALHAGAAIALVSQERAHELAGFPLIVVSDPLTALVDLARYARSRSTARIVAVTGSAGKTTTREAIKLALRGAGTVHASIKSFNNHWGVPLMLARMPEETAFGIFEIGMNHAGEITPLSELVRPHVSVITNVAAAHLEAFDSVEDIARAKSEIFAGMTPGGTAILNADHPYLDVVMDEAARHCVPNIVTYGYAPFADVRVSDAHPSDKGTSALVEIGGARHTLNIAAAGKHMVSNAAGAIAVCHVLGAELSPVLSNLRRFSAPEGRGDVHVLGRGAQGLTLIDESYNANPASMRAALSVFAEREVPGRRMLVLGDMLELGETSPDLHADLAEAVTAARADAVYLVGPHMAYLADRLGPDGVTAAAGAVDDIRDEVLNSLAFGDLVMVKGSNGIRLSRLVAGIREQFRG